ncbi:MAG: alanine dehydrogenase, partial [Erysipelotrichaceae bacterium]|nr:alanine dehydrogenase [Erysipelotrichaceae bacterium]
GMGANITIIGRNLHKLEVLDDQYHSSIQTLYSSDSNIEKACKDADLVIGAVLVPGAAAPKLFKKRYLKEMKPGSVFVDVSIDQGGCGESSRVTSHDDPIYIEDGVIHYCVGNMPGAVPRTSTIALTNATVKYGLQIANKGLKKACEENSAIYSAINTFGGKVVCKGVADAFGMECSDIRGLL